MNDPPKGPYDFDAEDLRLIESLGPLAAAAFPILNAFHSQGERDQTLRDMNEALLVSSVRQHELTDQAQKSEAALRESEQNLAVELAAAQSLQQISTRLIQGDNMPGMYEAILDAAMGIMRSDMASIQIVDESEDALRLLAWRGFEPEFRKIFELNRRDTRTSCSVARQVGHRVIVPDVETWDFIVGTRALEDHRKTGIRAVQSTPLVSRSGKMLGMISTYWREPHQPSERDLRLLDVLARQAADVIEHNQFEQMRAHLSAIVESSADAIISKDLNGVIMSWNDGAERIFGYTAAEAIGQSVTLIIPPDCMDEERVILERISRGERIEHYETVRTRKDGQRLPVSLTISPIKDSAGRVIGASKIARDVTEGKRAEEQIKTSLKEKEILLREIHHRVKNNLQIILSLLSMQSNDISDAHARAKFQESQERIRSIGLIHEKLYQSNKLGKIEMSGYIQNLVDSLVHSYDVRPDLVTVRLDVDDGSLGHDTAVPCGLILNELVTNALKHAFPGGRKGNIHIEFRGEGPGGFSLTVGDDGVGLPADLDFRNTGSLGLQLVYELTHQLHGTIELERDGGTVFRIRFAEVGGQYTRNATRILIVEDERVVALDLRRMLKSWGYTDLALATSGQQAIDKADEFHPDLVLMDVVLEEQMDGVETAARIQQGHNVPVIFVTAHGDDSTSYRARESSQAAVVRFVTKPIDERGLRTAIQVALNR